MNDIAIQMCQTMLQSAGGKVTRELIAQKVDELLVMPTFRDSLDRESIIKKLEELFIVWVDEAQVLSDNDDHKPWLPGKKGLIDWDFWTRYKLYISKSLPPAAVDNVDDITDKILERLEDPQSDGPWDRRGLVMGNVQSGKTANYTGLICKAADAGYKVIIVLAGLHNNLRSQTQIRLDDGFLGYRADIVTPEGGAFTPTGVGFLNPGLKADSVTNRHNNGDFHKTAANQFAINPGGHPLLFVVKKNVSVLNNLLRWIRGAAEVTDPLTGRKFHKDTPLLVIDDESDQASVDTKTVALNENGGLDDEHNPTKTNSLIRKLLYSFGKSGYVGYTATPFANIFIHEHNKTKAEGEDLFPRSFIINIRPPSNYTGPSRIFGIEEDESAGLEGTPSLPITRTIDDYAVKKDHSGKPSKNGFIGLAETEGWMPPKLLDKTEHIPMHEGEETIPPSLRTAMLAFILSTAIREIREGQTCHNSMLVHVTRFTKVQGHIGSQITQSLRDVCNRLQHGDGTRTPTILQEFKDVWQTDYTATSADPVFSSESFDDPLTLPTWAEVERDLCSVSLSIEVRSINGSAGDVLDYENYTERGLNVIAVGADKLSRGLTLEGLTISYFLRASKMYDTLMQMGRWFGYRNHYVDVCRLYTTVELVDWFGHIAAASEELRLEFDYMVNVGGTPRDYGLKVRSHPVLLVTSAVKMKNGTNLKLTYSGDISETIIFDTDQKAIEGNWEATALFVSELPTPKERSAGNGYTWTDIGADSILKFLEEFKSHPDARRADTKLLSSYIKRQTEQDELVDWDILLASSSKKDTKEYELAPIGELRVLYRAQHPEKASEGRYSIRRLLSPADEIVGLSDQEFTKALEATKRSWEADTRKNRAANAPRAPGGKHIRDARPKTKALLMLYPLDGSVVNKSQEIPIMGLAISFPSSDTAKEISYTANNVFTNAGDLDNI
ncbi:Z1 domain-containing protein [Akkermansiaceae bacterium]|nr:Z1 domain-containing protein [Akkermansiaceae bacterium]